MTLDPSIIISVSANILAIGVVYGQLHQRVKALESEMPALKDLLVQVAELRIMIGNLIEQQKELNASIRWMRDPAPPYNPQARSRPPRRAVTDKDEGR